MTRLVQMGKRGGARFSTRNLLGIGTTCFLIIGVFGVSQTNAQPTTKRKAISQPLDRARFQQAQSAAGTRAATAATPAPLSQTFELSSRPNATKTIYLDFTGHSTTGTDWNDSSATEIVTAPFSIDNSTTFSNTELTMIQEIWSRVSECYSPFDVNVTTKEPAVADLINSGGSDTRWGKRVCIGVSAPDPAPGAGGVAFLESFSSNKDTPCFVFPQNLSNSTKPIADATVHEVGHTVGLSHDGRTSPVEEYYFGQGSGVTSWGPHMGAGYYVNLVQWSKGEYLNASNKQDDLQIITTSNGFTYRADDYADTSTTAGAIGGTKGTGANATTFTISQSGVIERTTDTDWFKIVADTGTISVSLAGATYNTMLDAKLTLYNSIGGVVVSNNPSTSLTASFNQSVPAGTYYLSVDGVGNGDPLGTGYTEYSSLGQYTLTGSYKAAPTYPPSNVNVSYDAGQKTLTIAGDSAGNSVAVSYKANVLKIEGANGTKINSTEASVSYSHTGTVLVVNVAMGDGADSISFTGVQSTTSTINLGPGDDKVAFTLCNVGELTIYGEAGTDSYITTSSTITTLTKNSVP